VRLIPSVVTRDTKSDAERTVFTLLESSDLGPHARCFHSLNISQHEYKLVGELDFVVLCPEGLIVLEVKGGGVACHDGLWTFSDRFGRDHKTTEGPFRQARSGMFSLRSRLKDELAPQLTAGLVFGYGVVTPDADLPESSAEWAPEMLLDANKLRRRTEIADLLRSLIQYWSAKTKAPRSLSPKALEDIAAFLRPDFDRVPSLRHRADQIDVSMERLTGEQYRQLDLVEDSERVICAGGAGTGKTFLAAEVARREAVEGARVLLTCKSGPLAAFLAPRVAAAGVEVRPLDAVAAPTDGQERYDVLVVDEAQDALDFDTLAQLDGLVAGGLEDGRWRMFYDANNQSSIDGSFDTDALEYVRSLAGARGSLHWNCRNTREIVIQTKLLTAADLGNPSAGHGLPVEYAFFSDASEQPKLLEAQLRRLRDDDIDPGDITILSAHSYEDSAVTRMRPKWRERIRVLDRAAAVEWPLRQMTFATIRDFKGLENQFIAIVDVDSVAADARSRALLYVAMSRARAGLWIALHERLRGELETVSKANLADVMQEGDLARS
jgi:Nuclease-related domain/UvrD-like helicase C-terminal domain/AAA domain